MRQLQRVPRDGRRNPVRDRTLLNAVSRTELCRFQQLADLTVLDVRFAVTNVTGHPDAGALAAEGFLLSAFADPARHNESAWWNNRSRRSVRVYLPFHGLSEILSGIEVLARDEKLRIGNEAGNS